MAARKQRETGRCEVPISPWRACPQWPNFLPLGPTPNTSTTSHRWIQTITVTLSISPMWSSSLILLEPHLLLPAPHSSPQKGRQISTSGHLHLLFSSWDALPQDIYSFPLFLGSSVKGSFCFAFVFEMQVLLLPRLVSNSWAQEILLPQPLK
jgi:hypothetical protein